MLHGLCTLSILSVTTRIMMINLVACDTLKKRSILNRKAESPPARLGRRRVWATFMLIALISCFLKDYSVAKENYKPMHYRQYILITLNDLDETYCLIDLYTAESRLNPKARNGSHYGIPQGRSKSVSYTHLTLPTNREV